MLRKSSRDRVCVGVWGVEGRVSSASVATTAAPPTSRTCTCYEFFFFSAVLKFLTYTPPEEAKKEERAVPSRGERARTQAWWHTETHTHTPPRQREEKTRIK